MDKMREEFEAWGENQYEEHWSNLCGRTKENLFDCYRDAWQASRKALVVELPVAFPVCDDKDSAEVAYVLDILEKLALAGVSYK